MIANLSNFCLNHVTMQAIQTHNDPVNTKHVQSICTGLDQRPKYIKNVNYITVTQTEKTSYM